MQKIDINAALQAHPEFLNEKIDDRDKAVYAKGWNDCNKEYYNAITELPVASIDCTDLSARLRRAFEADELVNQRILLDAADAIEELLAERDRYKSFFDRIKDLPDCNICLKKNRCEFEPRPGEHTRINCAFCLTAPPKEPAHE